MGSLNFSYMHTTNLLNLISLSLYPTLYPPLHLPPRHYLVLASTGSYSLSSMSEPESVWRTQNAPLWHMWRRTAYGLPAPTPYRHPTWNLELPPMHPAPPPTPDRERWRISLWNWKLRFVPRILGYPPEKMRFQFPLNSGLGVGVVCGLQILIINIVCKYFTQQALLCNFAGDVAY